MPATTTAPVPWMSSLNDSSASAVPLEHRERVAAGEVLPLHERVRKHLRDGLDQLVEQREIRLAAQPPLAHAEVERIGQQRRVVGADVEIERQALRRMDARADRVQRQLADRDRHAADALVADAEDRLVVGDDDDARVVAGGVAQHVARCGRGPRGET